MSVLGVSSARQVDGGAWSCTADDARRRRCRALTLTVITPPTIRLVPSTLTVYKVNIFNETEIKIQPFVLRK